MTAIALQQPVDTRLCFSKPQTGIGHFSLRPLSLPDDIPRLHDWLTRDYARFWGMQDATPADIESFYHDLMASSHADAYLGLHDGSPAFLVECYMPLHDPVGQHYDVRPGDRGMHFLVAPSEKPIAGFTLAVMRTIMEFIFSDPFARRVVVEPDVRNEKIHVLNQRVGFEYDRVIQLGEKTAHLAFCTREQYAASLVSENRP
jgi:RimJ/RimL family protein N-acetyltransferase